MTAQEGLAPRSVRGQNLPGCENPTEVGCWQAAGAPSRGAATGVPGRHARTRRLYVGEPPEYKSREVNRAEAAFGRLLNSPAPGRTWPHLGEKSTMSQSDNDDWAAALRASEPVSSEVATVGAISDLLAKLRADANWGPELYFLVTQLNDTVERLKEAEHTLCIALHRRCKVEGFREMLEATRPRHVHPDEAKAAELLAEALQAYRDYFLVGCAAKDVKSEKKLQAPIVAREGAAAEALLALDRRVPAVRLAQMGYLSQRDDGFWMAPEVTCFDFRRALAADYFNSAFEKYICEEIVGLLDSCADSPVAAVFARHLETSAERAAAAAA
ncbi:MAG: hypothetical protein ACFCUW_02290 [Kiloniellaceae bacterium]